MKTFQDMPAQPRTGFTLVELLIVIAIIAILATLVVSLAESVRGEGAARRTEADIKILWAQIMAYRDASPNHEFPRSIHNSAAWDADPNGRKALDNALYLFEQLNRIERTRNEVRERFSVDRFAQDPNTSSYYLMDGFQWGRPFNYLQDGGPGGTPVLMSAGDDGEWDSADDIRSDERRLD